MHLTRCVILALALAVAITPTVRADDGTPVAVPPTAAVEPTQPAVPVGPVADTPGPVPIATPEPTQVPLIPVAPEQGHAVERSQAPVPSTTESGSAPSATEPQLGTTSSALPGRPPGPRPAGQPTAAATNPGDSGPPAAPVETQPPDVTILTGTTQISSGAEAPAQLSCKGKSKPDSGPFLSSPYAGWSDINSFLDHDSPDYSVDGKLVLASGLIAEAGAGQASDVFPAYWSSALRQFVNYDGHNGYDFGISYQPLLAAAPGTVTFAGWNSDDPNAGYGQMVLIDHHNGYVTLYGHLSKLEVKQGAIVQAGEEIGISGSTGNSTGPHLHFSVFHNCQVTDPYGWTGRGKDPLGSFDGEESSYLWLPGHDPLVLNPPPGWPAYPSGLKVALPWRHGGGPPARVVPPAGRLLLLSLPLPGTVQSTSAGVAIARTTAVMSQEEETLLPYLHDLEGQGLVDSYQAVPSAAAVWIRGTASAPQLESLPGVASLSGGQPKDVAAAQIGLAHSVLIQVGRAQAPSLWPPGFRSALHPWRPVASVVRGLALVAGFGLPGQRVQVTLRKGKAVVARGSAVADPETGGFAATLIDPRGRAGDPEPGGVLRVNCAGRTADVPISPLLIKAKTHGINGAAPAGSSVDVALVAANGTLGSSQAVPPSHSGAFRVRVGSALAAGTMGVASVLDGGGNEEADAAVVPGAEVDLERSTVRGWASGANPAVSVLRSGRLVARSPLHPIQQGLFAAHLRFGLGSLHLQAGDTVRIGSATRARVFTLPPLRLDLRVGAKSVTLGGTAGQRVQIRLLDHRSRARALRRVVPASGRVDMRWPFGSVGLGDSAQAVIQFATGDSMVLQKQVSSIEIGENTAELAGRSRPGVPLTFQLLSPHNVTRAEAFTLADPSSGKYVARFTDSTGMPVRIQPGETVQMTDAGSVSRFPVPVVALDRATGLISAPAGAELRATIRATRGHGAVYRLKVGGAGKAALPSVSRLGAGRLELSFATNPSTKITRSFSLAPRSAASRPAKP